MKGRPCVAIAQEVWPSLSATTVMLEWPSHPSSQQQTRVLAVQDPPGSINWQLDDMLSMPFSPQFINYEPSRGFMVSKFTTYDGTSDPFDHIMHSGQLMTLVIGYDALLCKVSLFNQPTRSGSLVVPSPPKELHEQFSGSFGSLCGHYLCSACHKLNISTLQNIKMQENESLREFMKRFGQVVLQVESYSMDAILQIFKRNICLGTPFFESLTKNPLATMDDLFKQANKYSMLKDDVRVAT